MTKRYFKAELPITNRELYDIMTKKVSEDERKNAGFKQPLHLVNYITLSFSMIYFYGEHKGKAEFSNSGEPLTIEDKNADEIKGRLEKLLKLNLIEINAV